MKSSMLFNGLALFISSALALPVSFTITENSGTARNAFPAVFGIPVAKGLVTGTGLEQKAPVHVPGYDGQFATIAVWPDGSAKWILCDLQPTLGADGSQSFSLVGGAQIPSTSLQVTDAADKITVHTGVISFEVLKGNSFNGLNKVWNGADLMVQAGSKSGLILTQGTTEFIGRANADSCLVEESGPMRVAIKVAGFFFNGSTRLETPGASIAAVGKRPMRFVMRIHAYAGKDHLTIHTTFQNPGFYANTGEALTFKGLKLRLGYLRPSSAAAAGPNQYSTGLSASDELEFLQAGLGGAATSSWCARPAATETGSNYVHYYTKNGTDAAVNKLVEGWLDINGSGLGILASMRNFWQMHPGGIASVNDGLEIRFLPNDVKGWVKWDDDVTWMKTPDYYMLGGRQRTWVSDIRFYRGAQDARAAADFNRAVQSPLVGLCTAEHYADNSGLRRIVPPGMTLNAGVEYLNDALERQERAHRIWQDTSAQDINAMGYKADLDMIRDYGRFKHPYGWVNFGDWSWAENYNNLHYDIPATFFTGFMKFGNSKMFREASDEAVFLRDLGTFNHWQEADYGWPAAGSGTDPEWVIWKDAGGNYYEKWRHMNLGYMHTPTPTHTWSEGIAMHYLLTGDRLSRDVLRRKSWFFVRSMFETYKMGRAGTGTPFTGSLRAITWPIYGLCLDYDIFAEDTMLTVAKKAFNQLLYVHLANTAGTYRKQNSRDWEMTNNMVRIGIAGVLRLYNTIARASTGDPVLSHIVEWGDTISAIMESDRLEGGFWREIAGDSVRFPIGHPYALGDPTESLNRNQAYLFSYASLESFLYLAHGKTEPSRLEKARRMFVDAARYCDAPSNDVEIQCGFYTGDTDVKKGMVLFYNTADRTFRELDSPAVGIPEADVYNRRVGYRKHANYHSKYVSRNTFVDGWRIIVTRSDQQGGTECKALSNWTLFADDYLYHEWDMNGRPADIESGASRNPAVPASLFAAPNPFNPSIALRLRNAKGGPWTNPGLKIYNISGRLVFQSEIRDPESGIVWNAGRMPSGTYIVRVQAGRRTLEKKISLVK
jgi:hypothetical protein